VRDSLVTLTDGRAVAYTDIGAPDGAAVMYFHGAPTSRLDLVAYRDEFAGRGIRVISPDRPGYGGSSPHPGRTLEAWPDDVAELSDRLGVGSFTVIGYSSGGPYAVACAALLHERVVAAGVVAGVTDRGWAPAWDGYDETESELMRLADEDAAVAWCEARFGADGSRFLEGDTTWAPADLALLADEARAADMLATLRESFRQGVVGYAHDVTVQGRPWAFDPGAVVVPVRVFHGEADTLVPLAHSRHTAEVIAGADLVTWPEAGHLSIVTELPRLAAELVSRPA
jgi:pimeloyl-ACP methyl ester carboxylesterase